MYAMCKGERGFENLTFLRTDYMDGPMSGFNAFNFEIFDFKHYGITAM